ncbi:MAG: c-type cytochrome [Gemmatimonadaceae bacterium]
MRSHSTIAVIGFLAIGVAYASSFAAAAPQPQDPAGKAPYEENCRKCHGVRGVPPKTMKAKYSKIPTFDEEFFDKRTPDSVVAVLVKGKGEDMKSFKEKLSYAQMVAVSAYIRSFGVKAEQK